MPKCNQVISTTLFKALVRILRKEPACPENALVWGLRDVLTCVGTNKPFNESKVNQMNYGSFFTSTDHDVIRFQISVQVAFTVKKLKPFQSLNRHHQDCLH